MAQFLAPIINDQQVDANGDPLSGGKIYVYLAGSSTPVTTYSDKAGLVPNTNPLTLNTLGVSSQGAVWLTGGVAYKFVIQNAALVTQRTIDNVSGIGDTAVIAEQWLVYQATPTYVSATSFTVAGDQTQTFQIGRRIKTTNTGGTVYSTITGSVYGAPNTTVTVRNDSGVLDSGLSAVSYSLLSVLDTAIPGGTMNYGQCRLSKSGANLLLSPLNGNRITINGSICVIPAAGVTLAPTSLTPSTVYFIYAYMSGATLTLEASTTGHSVDAVTGVEIKTGDATRTLVGMARTIAGPAWVDTSGQRFVISWFNQRTIFLNTVLSANQGSASTGTYAELNTNLRLEFLNWVYNAVSARFQGRISNNVLNSVSTTTLALDGTVIEAFNSTQAYVANALMPVSIGVDISTTEGYHYITPFAQQDVSSTATYTGSGTAGVRCSHSGVIQG